MAYTTINTGAAGALTAATVTVPSGGYYNTNASVTLSGHNHNWATSAASVYAHDPSVNITGDGITMKEDTDIKIGDVSLKQFMSDVNRRLGIMVPNPKLEKEFEQLKKLRDQYEALERECAEKAHVWETLKRE